MFKQNNRHTFGKKYNNAILPKSFIYFIPTDIPFKYSEIKNSNQTISYHAKYKKNNSVANSKTICETIFDGNTILMQYNYKL